MRHLYNGLKRFWFQAHWLVGITAGIVLAVVGATGAMLSFEDEIQNWLNREVRMVQAAGSAPLAPDALLARVREQQPEARITALQFSAQPEAAVRASMGRQSTLYVDPYNGKIAAGEGTRGREFFRNVRSLHRWLVAGTFGNREVGRHIVGVSTLLCTALALTGLYLRWPRRAGNWRNWLTFDPALKGRPFLWHLHAVIGTWVLVMLLVMSLTGPYWSYNWYRNGMYAVSGVERPAPRGNEGQQSREPAQPRERSESRGGAARDADARGERRSDPAPAVYVDTAWHAFAAAAGRFRTATLNLPQKTGDPIEIRYVAAGAHSRANNTMVIDGHSGAVVRHERYADKTAGGRFMSSVLAWHSGSVFGVIGKGLFMLGALAMPVFTITGWMMYLQRRSREKLLRRRGGAPAQTPAGTQPSAAGQVSAHIRNRL